MKKQDGSFPYSDQSKSLSEYMIQTLKRPPFPWIKSVYSSPDMYSLSRKCSVTSG